MQGVWRCLLIGVLVGMIAARTAVVPGNEPEPHPSSIPEFFDDDLNILCLIIGFAIIILSVIVALIIFRVKSRSAAFEGSLFQNLEE